MRRFGAVLFWLGLVILIAGAAIGWFGGTRAVEAVRTTVDEAGPMPGSAATVQLEEGDRRTIYEQTQSDIPSASCQVIGPDGGALELSRSAEVSGSLGETSYINVGEFEAATSGTHTVTCTGATTLIGPSLDFSSLGAGALGVLGGILGAGLGLLMMLIGAILWFVGRSKDRDRRTGQGSQGYGSGSYDGGHGGRPPPPPPSG
ncbi:MAG: hypothetical protein ACR2FV_16240 [Ornithinimicrobium sp.]|uniref:hypothetical protein n=1 Tax=Ornithinimicrobium sp. TaxID=1977084 RepID=UPI003D9BAFE8